MLVREVLDCWIRVPELFPLVSLMISTPELLPFSYLTSAKDHFSILLIFSGLFLGFSMSLILELFRSGNQIAVCHQERGRVICSLINHQEVPRSLQSSVGHQPLCRYGFLRAYSTMAMELQASKGSKRSLLSSHNMAKFPRPTSITGFRTEGHVRKGSRHLQHRVILNLKPRRNPRARRKPRRRCIYMTVDSFPVVLMKCLSVHRPVSSLKSLSAYRLCFTWI